MIIGSISEDLSLEKRVAITPDTVKKYKTLGLDVCLKKSYASHLGISDDQYAKEGASFLETNQEIISKSDAILQLNILKDEDLNKLKQNQILVGVLNPYVNEKKNKGNIFKKYKMFFT